MHCWTILAEYRFSTVTMFSSPFYRSAILCVLLVIVFGIAKIALLADSIPTNETCVNVNGEEIYHFKGSENVQKNWEEAQRLCSSINSTLPVFRNKKEQDALACYLRSHNINNSGVWTSGRNFTLSQWTWINGKPLEDADKVKLQENQEEEQKQLYASVHSNFSFQAQDAFQENRYICQYKGVSCNVSSDFDLTVDCFNLSDDNRTWYEARNQCIKTGGDLAVISDNVSAMLRPLESEYSYWIGLRKESWQWMRNDESNDEIKYTNWDNSFATEGECISIDTPTGKWKAVGCNEIRAAVCQRGQDLPSTTTLNNVQTIVDTVTSTSKESTTDGSKNLTSQSLLFLAVGAGIVIIIICVVIIVFALRSTRKSVTPAAQSKGKSSSSQNDSEEIENKLSNTPTYAFDNAPGDSQPEYKTDDIRGVYADIPLAAISQAEEEATNQQPEIVYASVEFQEESTHMESNKQRDNAASPTNVGPLGDTYAIPDVKGHAVTSPGYSSDGSDSHPIKVTALGDVYALPVKKVEAPTEKPLGEVADANLQP